MGILVPEGVEGFPHWRALEVDRMGVRGFGREPPYVDPAEVLAAVLQVGLRVEARLQIPRGPGELRPVAHPGELEGAPTERLGYGDVPLRERDLLVHHSVPGL
jgi:hypothetical protein